MNERMNEIKKALHSLGYKGGTTIIIETLGKDRAIVRCRETVIGIYDFTKHTFID